MSKLATLAGLLVLLVPAAGIVAGIVMLIVAFHWWGALMALALLVFSFRAIEAWVRTWQP
jgi:hypothetical protein